MSRPRRAGAARTELLILALLVPALFPLQGWFLAHPAPELDLVGALPPARVLPALAVGHGALAADVLELRATGQLLRTLRPGGRLDRDQLLRSCEAVAALDPQDPDAPVRFAVLLTSVADQPLEALRVLRSAIERVPVAHLRRWRIFWELAATHLTALAARAEGEGRRDEIRQAGRLLVELAEQPGVPRPEAFRALGERLVRSGLSVTQALEQERLLWEERARSSEPVLRERARQRLEEVDCALRLEQLNRALTAFRAQTGREPPDLAALRQDLTDPLGVGFRLQEGRVIAPGLDARRATRALHERAEHWRAGHPGVAPRLADLMGEGRLSPWLEAVADDAGGFQVRPR